MIKVGKSNAMNLVTSSDVIADLKADKKPTEMHPFLMKKDCHLVVKSPVNKFGPFSFLSIDPQSSPGLEMNPQPTCLDFQVPKQNLESEFEAYTFLGSKKLKLKFVYQRGTGKYILSTKEKKQLELSLVLGAPIIIENEDVLKKHLSSRWSVVGVIGLNEERELCPYFVTTDLFGSRPVQREEDMHVQYSLSETTRIHDLSTRKMHLIRGNRRTAVLTNRTICTIRESLLRPVSIRVLRVIVAVCRLFLSTRKRQNNTVAQLSPLLHRSVRFVKRLYDPCRLDYCMLLPIYMPVNVCMRRGPICE